MITLETLIEESKSDLEIDILTIGDQNGEIVNTQLMIGKWLEYQQIYKSKLLTMSIEYKKITGLRTLYYYGKLSDKEINNLGWEIHGNKISKSELMSWIDCDKYISEYKLKYEMTKQTLYLIDKTLDLLGDKRWSVKNLIDFKRFMEAS
jgi:hypothetical protein